jgi:hypothetical protein
LAEVKAFSKLLILDLMFLSDEEEISGTWYFRKYMENAPQRVVE